MSRSPPRGRMRPGPRSSETCSGPGQPPATKDLSIFLSIYTSIYMLSMYSSICLYIYIFTYPSIYLFIKLHLYIYSSIYIYISICLHTCAAVDALAAWRMVWATPGLTLNTHTRKVDDSSCNKFQKLFWALDLRGFSLGGGGVSVTSH